MKIKENSLREGHPEKTGVEVKLEDLVHEVRTRIKRKAELDRITQQAEGLRVIGGIRAETEKKENEPLAPATETGVPETKPEEAVEKIGAVTTS